MRHLTLLLAAAGLASSAGAQQAASVATPERDAAALYVAQADFIVATLAGQCLEVVGRAVSPRNFIADWEQRNARYLKASNVYLNRRLDEATAAGGEARRLEVAQSFHQTVQDGAEATLRKLLQGRREDGCMDGITLIDTGRLDVNDRLPQFKQIEALAAWAEK
jgi:hypothetical protein